MNLRAVASLLAPTQPRDIILVLSLGSLGFALNTMELSLGWGVHFLFGNALIYAFVRVLAPKILILAISISSLWTIFLWDHPWAWLVWVCEAIFIAAFARKSSPVRSDVIFWLVLGGPLLLVTCGLFLKLDMLSLILVVLKQAANGVFNIVLGELLYVALIAINPLLKFGHWPKLRVESVVITLLMAVILLPTTVYLALDAPSREQAARQDVGRSLEYTLRVSDVALNSWIQSRSLVLRMHAEAQFDGNGPIKTNLLNELSSEFELITTTAQGRTSQWAAPSVGENTQIMTEAQVQTDLTAAREIRLVTLEPKVGQSPRFGLTVPFNENGNRGVIVAQLRDGVLQDLVSVAGQSPAYGIYLVNPVQGVLSLSPSAASSGQQLERLSNALRMASLDSAVLLSTVSYGQAVMSDLANAQIMRSSMMAELPEWQVFAIAPLAPAVARARNVQLQQFFALLVFILLISIIASVLSRRMSYTLRALSQSAADLSPGAATSDSIGGHVVQEMHEISGRIATAGTTVGQERSALASYQRRLNSVAQHAPVIVYALEVDESGEGELIFVSESLEKILGYTQDDTAESGWWARALHPDDNLSCSNAFGNLSLDRSVHQEYRLKHKDGHYVWVYDSRSVETNPHSGKLEAVGVIMDISERKATAEQLLQADKMASLGRMISGTAHELNQPLNFIKMATSNLRENILRGRTDSDRLMPKLENVLAQVERASAILLQMRVFGRTPKEPAYPFDVKVAVDAVMMMVGPQFELDGTQIQIVEKSGPVHVKALPMLLEQVLLNLLINANDAIQSRQREGNAPQGKIKISLERRNQLAIIAVTDNGTGIGPDELGKLFEPFFSTKPPKEGTGLGLSISYGIIRDLGGVIRASSGRNGARFTIELPLAEIKAV